MSRPLQAAASAQDDLTFEIERLEISEGCLVISGHWSGVRGMRFVRPTLVAGGRRVLATLEHKPWTPTPGRAWTVAFPWRDGDLDLEGLSLAVAPSVAVTLDSGSSATEQTQAPNADSDPDLALEPDPRCLELEQAVRLEQRKAQDAGKARQDLERARTAAERDRDRALAQVEEAVQDREAALRTRSRMEAQRDEAVQAREAAEAKLVQAIAARDEATAQRDEVLLAYTARQGEIASERADAGGGPIPGVNVSSIGNDRDLWVTGMLGTVAALSFIVLLVMILRVFI
jgi:hypothetical protein